VGAATVLNSWREKGKRTIMKSAPTHEQGARPALSGMPAEQGGKGKGGSYCSLLNQTKKKDPLSLGKTKEEVYARVGNVWSA